MQALSDWSIYPLDNRWLQIFLELCFLALWLILACNFFLLSFATGLTCLPALFSIHCIKICLELSTFYAVLLFLLLLFSPRPSCQVQELLVRYNTMPAFWWAQLKGDMVCKYSSWILKTYEIARPLYWLTERNFPFKWTTECQWCLEELKCRLTTTPVLAYPDYSRPFILDTDVSDFGIGAVLAQCDDDGHEPESTEPGNLPIVTALGTAGNSWWHPLS